MTIDDTTLLAYVDQQLDAAQRAQIEAAISTSEPLQRKLAALKASNLPYATAYAAKSTPAMPEELAQELSLMVSAASAAHSPNAPVESGLARRHWLGFGSAIAASFVAGVGVRHLMSANGQRSNDSLAPDWIEAVALYQSMYTRATVETSVQSAENAERELQKFLVSSAANGKFDKPSIPDLSAQGFEFKRVQNLAFGNAPLVQMAYLPKSGKPAALCVLAQGKLIKPQRQPILRRLHSMAMVSWNVGELGYALAVDSSDEQALALGRSILGG